VKLFPRREKLLQQLFGWKDPGLRRRSTGLFSLVLLLSVSTSAFAAAPFGGQASKGIRSAGSVGAAEPVEANAPRQIVPQVDVPVQPEGVAMTSGVDVARDPEVPPAYVVEARIQEPQSPLGELAEQVVPSFTNPTVGVDVAEGAETSAGISTPITRPDSSPRDGYLPSTGSVALRFARARDWPVARTSSPLGEDSSHAIAARDVRESGVDAESGAEVSVAAEPEATFVAGTENTSAADVPAVVRRATSTASSTLSADLVLGYINDLPGARAAGGERFVPATPATTSVSAGVAGSIP
jgi:hypothetical protein